jgi:transcriptional regulator with XRE-family HTH domain
MQNENLPGSLGNAIKTARKGKGLTQSELAGVLSITPRYLKALENSGHKPSYDLLTKIVRELGIVPDRIFYPESERPSAPFYIVKGGKRTG